MNRDSDAEISSDGMFENLSFVKMQSSKLIYLLTNMCQRGQGSLSPCIVKFLMLVDDNVFLGGEFFAFFKLEKHDFETFKRFSFEKNDPIPFIQQHFGDEFFFIQNVQVLIQNVRFRPCFCSN
jgi:hypothetical protein